MYDRGEVITKEERDNVVNWVCSNYDKMKKMRGKCMYEMMPGDTFVPEFIWDIRKRIVEREGLQSYKREYKVKDLVTVILKGGDVDAHIDINAEDLVHVRFNVYVLIPKSGCETYYAGHKVDVKEGRYVMCCSGIDLHWIDENIEDTPRIALSFGFLVPKEKVATLYKEPPTNIISYSRLVYQSLLRKYKEYLGLFNGARAIRHLYGENASMEDLKRLHQIHPDGRQRRGYPTGQPGRGAR